MVYIKEGEGCTHREIVVYIKAGKECTHIEIVVYVKAGGGVHSQRDSGICKGWGRSALTLRWWYM